MGYLDADPNRGDGHVALKAELSKEHDSDGCWMVEEARKDSALSLRGTLALLTTALGSRPLTSRAAEELTAVVEAIQLGDLC